MEENLKNKLERMQEMEDGFKDFDESEAPLSLDDIELAEANLQEQLKALGQNLDEASMFHEFKSSEEEKNEIEENKIETEIEDNVEEQENAQEEALQEEKQQEEKSETILSPWEEYANKEDSAVKKYIFYVSKDFVPIIDNLSIDERTAYINDAIQKKIDIENKEYCKESKKKVVIHFVVMILTLIIMAPVVLLGVHKAIMATFENYKYSQENFEKLYKSRFEKDRAYMRSVQYNKEREQKRKNAQ